MARPRKPINDSRGADSAHVAVRLTKTEKARAMKLAKARGLTLSELVRARLFAPEDGDPACSCLRKAS